MCDVATTADDVRSQIESLESRLHDLKRQLADLGEVAEVPNAKPGTQPSKRSTQGSLSPTSRAGRAWPLNATEYTRYGRQMIMPEIGLQGKFSRRSHFELCANESSSRAAQSSKVLRPSHWCRRARVSCRTVSCRCGHRNDWSC